MRTLLKSVAFLSVLSATSAFAISGYSTAPYTKNFNRALVPATNIAVLNYSTDVVYASVPGVGFTLFSGNDTTFTHPTYSGYTPLTLQDPYHNTFYSQQVCRYAVVFIDGHPGSYRTTVDGRYC